jgi:hypothetical protein
MNNVAVFDATEEQRLKEAMGMIPENTQSDRLPLLKINTDDENEDGQEIPRATMYLRDATTVAYAKEIKIRVLGQHYQYIEYDPDQNKTVCKTLINKSFKQTFLDTRGTAKCGMTKPKKHMEQYEKERFKNVTCFRHLRVLVTYKGVDAEGNSVNVENQPALMLLKGSNFMPFEDEVVKKLPRGASLCDFWIDVSLERKKNGSVTYYVMHYAFDASKVEPFDKETADTFRHFASMVEDENARIYEKHKAAISERSSDAYEVPADASLEADFA